MTTTRLFLINSDSTTPQPSESTITPRPMVGRFLNGTPVYQGYETLEVRYPYLTEANMAILEGLYTVASPAVTVQYFDALTTADATRNAMMEAPQAGTHGYGWWRDVSVKFSHLTPV